MFYGNWVKLIVFISIVLLSTLSLGNCYLFEQGAYLLTYQYRAEPIAKLLQEERLSEEEKALLRETQAIKRFAVEE